MSPKPKLKKAVMMDEIILKAKEPDKTAGILFEAIETEVRRLQYSLENVT